MLDQIKEQLIRLEQERGIRILLAVESGSRAWGIPSPDSDYDVRMIYIHDTEHYLSINDRKETIDYFEGDLLDISGWDIRKAMRLIGKSNASPMEWCRSPIVYKEEVGFRAQLEYLTSQYFEPKHTVNHYLGIAKNSLHTNYKEGKIVLKKLFYILRPLLAAKSIIVNEEIPPITLDELMVNLDDKKVKKRIEDLILYKENAAERYVYEVEDYIMKYIDELFFFVKNNELVIKDKNRNSNILNSAFRALLAKY